MDRNNLVGTRGTVVLFPPGQEDLCFDCGAHHFSTQWTPGQDC